MPPWDDYDEWEARDRTLLEAASLGRQRLEREIAQHRAQTMSEVEHALYEAMRVGPRDPARYRSPSPDMETT